MLTVGLTIAVIILLLWHQQQWSRCNMYWQFCHNQLLTFVSNFKTLIDNLIQFNHQFLMLDVFTIVNNQLGDSFIPVAS